MKRIARLTICVCVCVCMCIVLYGIVMCIIARSSYSPSRSSLDLLFSVCVCVCACTEGRRRISIPSTAIRCTRTLSTQARTPYTDDERRAQNAAQSPTYSPTFPFGVLVVVLGLKTVSQIISCSRSCLLLYPVDGAALIVRPAYFSSRSPLV